MPPSPMLPARAWRWQARARGGSSRAASRRRTCARLTAAAQRARANWRARRRRVFHSLIPPPCSLGVEGLPAATAPARVLPPAHQPVLPPRPPRPHATGVQAAQLPHRRDARRGHQAGRPARAPGAARAARPAHRQGHLRAAVARRRRHDAHGQRQPREAARRRQGATALAAGLLCLCGVPARAGA